MKKNTILTISIIIILGGFITFRAISISRKKAQTPNYSVKKESTKQINSLKPQDQQKNAEQANFPEPQNQKKITQTLNIDNLRYATLSIDGMWCSGCTTAAEYSLKEQAGVINASVGFTENSEGIGEVIYDPEQIDLESLIKAVEPYKAKVINDTKATKTNLETL